MNEVISNETRKKIADELLAEMSFLDPLDAFISPPLTHNVYRKHKHTKTNIWYKHPVEIFISPGFIPAH